MRLPLSFKLAAVTLAGCTAAGAAYANDAVTFQLDWVPGGINAGWYYGVKNKCFSERGIDLTIVRGYGAGDAITKVATGSVPFGVTDLGVIIASRTKSGAPVKAIVPIVAESPFGIAVLGDSPIKTIKDLEGKTIASAPSDATTNFLALGMKAAGADMSKITKQSVEQTALTGLLLQGKVDAITSYVTSTVGLNTVAQKVGKKIRAINFGKDLNFYSASAFTSDAMIEKNPDLVKRFSEAAACAYTGAFANPTGAIDAIVEQVSGMQRESQLELVPFSLSFASDSATYKKFGFKWDMDRVERTIQVTKEALAIDKALPATDFIYVPK